jgi:hypothetical protein
MRIADGLLTLYCGSHPCDRVAKPLWAVSPTKGGLGWRWWLVGWAGSPPRNSLRGSLWLQCSIWMLPGVPWERRLDLACRPDMPEQRWGYSSTDWSSLIWSRSWIAGWWCCRFPIFSTLQVVLCSNQSELFPCCSVLLPITETYLEDPVELSRRIFQFLVLLCLRIKIILEVRDWGRIIWSPFVCLDGKYSQIFACHVQARYCPGFKVAIAVSSDDLIGQVFPRFINLRPCCLETC